MSVAQFAKVHAALADWNPFDSDWGVGSNPRPVDFSRMRSLFFHSFPNFRRRSNLWPKIKKKINACKSQKWTNNDRFWDNRRSLSYGCGKARGRWFRVVIYALIHRNHEVWTPMPGPRHDMEAFMIDAIYNSEKTGPGFARETLAWLRNNNKAGLENGVYTQVVDVTSPVQST